MVAKDDFTHAMVTRAEVQNRRLSSFASNRKKHNSNHISKSLVSFETAVLFLWGALKRSFGDLSSF